MSVWRFDVCFSSFEWTEIAAAWKQSPLGVTAFITHFHLHLQLTSTLQNVFTRLAWHFFFVPAALMWAIYLGWFLNWSIKRSNNHLESNGNCQSPVAETINPTALVNVPWDRGNASVSSPQAAPLFLITRWRRWSIYLERRWEAFQRDCRVWLIISANLWSQFQICTSSHPTPIMNTGLCVCVCVCLKSSCRLCFWSSSWKSSPSSLYSTTFQPSLTSQPSQPDFNQSKQFSLCVSWTAFPLWVPVPGHRVPLISDLHRVLHRQSIKKSALMSNKCSTFLIQLHLIGLVAQSRNSYCFHHHHHSRVHVFNSPGQKISSHSCFWSLSWSGGPVLTCVCFSNSHPPNQGRCQPLVACLGITSNVGTYTLKSLLLP